MSEYKNCALYADANTPPRYCCTRKVFTVDVKNRDKDEVNK